MYKELVQTYVAAWSANDEAQRRALLEQCWEKDGVYSDPGGQAVGREALVQHIGAFQRQYAGYHLQVIGRVEAHHRQLRFTWDMVKADGSRFITGTDFGEVTPDGRLLKLTGFFN